MKDKNIENSNYLGYLILFSFLYNYDKF